MTRERPKHVFARVTTPVGKLLLVGEQLERQTVCWGNEVHELATSSVAAWGEARPNSLRPRGAARAAPTRKALERSGCKLIGVLGASVALCGLYFDDARHAEHAIPQGALEDRSAFAEVLAQLDAYFTGKRRAFELRLSPRGTEFQRRVWQELVAIPYGETTTYAAIARAIGKPKAVRAVGAANGKNPISIVVPCHRVIGQDGTLTGYAGGLPSKRRLLELEARQRSLL